ncbi:MAG: class I SAM-dependent methyltransferase [Mycobacterium sp.]
MRTVIALRHHGVHEGSLLGIGTDTDAKGAADVVAVGMRRKLFSAVAAQLGHPHGPLSRVVAVALNRGNRPATCAAVELSVAAPGQTVADIGFGGGLGLSLLLGRVGDDGVVYGIELSREMLDRARSRNSREQGAGRLRLVHGTLTASGLEDRSLDAAITVNTLYFVADLDSACRELVRVMRPGGRLVVGVGDPDAMAQLPFTRYGFILRPVAEVTAALRNAGFDLLAQRTLDEITVPHHLLVAIRSDAIPL